MLLNWIEQNSNLHVTFFWFFPLSQNVVSEQPSSDGKLKVMTFGKTPIMSTYLLAFVVGEFDYVEGKSLDGVCVRVYTPLSKKEHGQFALEVQIFTFTY